MGEKNCDNFEFIKLKPKNIEEIYDNLYNNMSYNIELIIILITNRNELGKIPIDIKKTIIKVIDYTINILKSFCEQDKYYSLYTDNKIFYSCMPYYNDYNKISIIKISDGIDFKSFADITIDMPDNKIEKIITELFSSINNYINK